MNDLTLVVMAAGMGSRFGGLKQITPVDDDGNFIIDYSVFDARKAGFKRVVFVIKEENLSIFEETIGKRLKDKIEVCYAFQKMDDIPKHMDIKGRIKPWGTVQAILAAKEYVPSSFVVINADDYYGSDAYLVARNFLQNVHEAFTYACIAYKCGNPSEGSVKRGVLSLDGEQIKAIIESKIEKTNDGLLATPLKGGNSFFISCDTLVSMNIFAFQHDVFTILEKYWNDYFLQSDEDILNGEALLPECLEEYLKLCKITILNRPSSCEWIGMTYKSDLDVVKKELQKLKDRGVYQKHLWD